MYLGQPRPRPRPRASASAQKHRREVTNTHSEMVRRGRRSRGASCSAPRRFRCRRQCSRFSVAAAMKAGRGRLLLLTPPPPLPLQAFHIAVGSGRGLSSGCSNINSVRLLKGRCPRILPFGEVGGGGEIRKPQHNHARGMWAREDIKICSKGVTKPEERFADPCKSPARDVSRPQGVDFIPSPAVGRVFVRHRTILFSRPCYLSQTTRATWAGMRFEERHTVEETKKAVLDVFAISKFPLRHILPRRCNPNSIFRSRTIPSSAPEPPESWTILLRRRLASSQGNPRSSKRRRRTEVLLGLVQPSGGK